jgi:hypothetical protein
LDSESVSQSLLQARVSSRKVELYEPVEVTLEVSAEDDSPFDPEQLDVSAEFTAPDKSVMRAIGFLDRPYARSLEGRQEKIVPAGPPVWKVRIASHQRGKWTGRVSVKDKSGAKSLPPISFEVAPSENPGFIRRSKRNPAVFAYENENPYFLVGENMCWGGWNGQRGTYDYDEWLAALGKVGGNWIRIWMSSWNCALEWSADPSIGHGEFNGVGHYNLAHAWKLDRILDTAERHGISTMLCFGTYGEFNEGGFFNEGQWKQNPYNAANGGPCAKPADFWTDETARKLYRRRLRYLIARYAHRTSIHSWEFWNEAQAPAAWVAEMAKYVKSIDPYNHLVTTTYGNKDVWQIPEIDITQTHHYGKGDIPDSAPAIRDDARIHTSFGKPHLMAEFGIDWRKGDENYDLDGKGVNLHNGMWASVASGCAGTAMVWWWDGYVHPKNLYARFTPIRRFVDKVPWTSGPWRPISCDVTPDSARVYGQTDGRNAVIWIQNAAHNWQSVFEKTPIPPLSESALAVRELAEGDFVVERWDTWSGEVAESQSIRAAGGELRIPLPAIEKDLAIRIAPKR